MFSFFKKKSEFEKMAAALQRDVLEAYKARTLDVGSVMPRLVSAKNEAYCRIAQLEGFERGQMAIVLVKAVSELKFNALVRTTWYSQAAGADFCRLAGQLVSTNQTLTTEDFAILVDSWFECNNFVAPFSAIVKIAERITVESGLTAKIGPAVRKIKKAIVNSVPATYPLAAAERKLILRLDCLLDPSTIGKIALTESWQSAFSDAEWEPMLRYAMTATATEMSERWAKGAKQLLGETDSARFLDQFDVAVSAVAKMDTVVDAVHSDMLRGLTWFASIEGSDRAAFILGRLLIASSKKIPGFGARSTKGFSGSAGALEKMGTFPAIAELSKARNKVKQFGLANSLTSNLLRAAQRQNMRLDDLEELVVPTFGLELPGVRTEALGSVEAGLEIQGSDSAGLRWFKGGKEFKSPPAEVKNEHAESLKELKQILKEIESTLPAQRARIEGMMLSGRALPYPTWRERYVDHPLLAEMSRRLIWRFFTNEQEVLGIPLDGVPVDVEGQPIQGLAENTLVRLWHPIHAGLSAVEAWREFLITHEIRQPFKQAHREIYILTEAEMRTGTYSNRFAAHFLRQHQMSALAKGRGWRYQLQGFFDNQNNPTLHLLQWAISVEFFVFPAEGVTMPGGDSHTEAGIAFVVSTDQVRFIDGVTPMSLDQVPPIVFSEAMRDVDLFVGVASLGNDPTWHDQGEQDGFRAYWGKVAFGDLTASAEIRKAVLERLLPRLAIGKVSRIEGKYLIVKGKLRTYKIHLGSGNILMSPNDQYLCIVPNFGKAGAPANYYLPFEGDGVFSIILSKAMMLADDDKIKDSTITSQIKWRAS